MTTDTTDTMDRAAVADLPNREVGVLLPLLEALCKSQRQLLAIKLVELDVAVGQDRYLLSFEDDTPVSVSHVAERLSIRSSTVSKMTDRLESQGWVARISSKDDARRVLLHLTTEGWKVRDAVLAAEAEVEADLLKALGGQEQTIAALKELDEVLAKRLRRLR